MGNSDAAVRAVVAIYNIPEDIAKKRALGMFNEGKPVNSESLAKECGLLDSLEITTSDDETSNASIDSLIPSSPQPSSSTEEDCIDGLCPYLARSGSNDSFGESLNSNRSVITPSVDHAGRPSAYLSSNEPIATAGSVSLLNSVSSEHSMNPLSSNNTTQDSPSSSNNITHDNSFSSNDITHDNASVAQGEFLNVCLSLVEKEHEMLEKSRMCRACRVKPKDITFLPCGHFTTCRACAEPIYVCPQCNTSILATIDTYLS